MHQLISINIIVNISGNGITLTSIKGAISTLSASFRYLSPIIDMISVGQSFGSLARESFKGCWIDAASKRALLSNMSLPARPLI